jgi:hypothetical protein
MEGQPPLPPEPERSPLASPAPSGPSLPPPPPGRLLVGSDRPLVLRPMGVGELLDAAIRLYRAEWKNLMAIVAIVLLPLEFLRAFLLREIGGPFAPPDPTLLPSEVESALITSSILGVIEFLVIQPFLTAAVARACSDVYLGHRLVVGPTFRYAATKIHSILWISILYGLAAALGFLALIVPGVIVLVRFAFGSTVLVVEGKKGSGALGRSWRLSQGHFWKVLGTFVLALLMAFIIQAILALPTGLIAGELGPSAWPLAAIGNALAMIATTPFTTLIAVLLYFDLRIRKEAFDLEVMAQEMASSR